ncbi:hypothetical protein AAC387_Pa03g0681 [Persea americana]
MFVSVVETVEHLHAFQLTPSLGRSLASNSNNEVQVKEAIFKTLIFPTNYSYMEELLDRYSKPERSSRAGERAAQRDPRREREMRAAALRSGEEREREMRAAAGQRLGREMRTAIANQARRERDVCSSSKAAFGERDARSSSEIR